MTDNSLTINKKQSVITTEKASARSTDDLIAVHTDFWLKALMPEVASPGSEIGDLSFSVATP
jgi:hypothetical protein